MRMTKTSQWAGYLASFFAIAYFVLFTAYRQSDFDGARAPSWWPVVIGWCMMLAAFSGVVCLVSALFAFARRRKDSTVPSQTSHDHTNAA